MEPVLLFIKKMYQVCIVSMLLEVRVATTETYFLHFDLIIDFMYYIYVPVCMCHYTGTFPQIYS